MRMREAENEPNTINNQKINTYINLGRTSVYKSENNPVSEFLTAEGCDDFLTYAEWLGLANDPNLVVLPSIHHYYYDDEDMKDVKTVINLKGLNQIKHVKSFLHSIFHILPQNSYFIGSFVDNKNVSGYLLRNRLYDVEDNISRDDVENDIVSRIPLFNRLYSLMDSRTNNYMSKTNVSLLLKDHGFKILDMTELNGLTYFCAQKLRTADN